MLGVKRKYDDEDKEKAKTYYLKHKDRIKARNKAYYLENKDSLKKNKFLIYDENKNTKKFKDNMRKINKLNVKIAKIKEKRGRLNINQKYNWGDDFPGTCLNCSGRGRKQHLEYYGDREVMCMVCGFIMKIEDLKGRLIK